MRQQIKEGNQTIYTKFSNANGFDKHQENIESKLISNGTYEIDYKYPPGNGDR